MSRPLLNPPYRWGALSPDYQTGMIRDREIARWVADTAGQFWLPCEICGEHYAGFEWGETLRTAWNSGHGTCAKERCRAETLHRNVEWVREHLPTADLNDYQVRSVAHEHGFSLPPIQPTVVAP